jgi:hypothetical protein
MGLAFKRGEEYGSASRSKVRRLDGLREFVWAPVVVEVRPVRTPGVWVYFGRGEQVGRRCESQTRGPAEIRIAAGMVRCLSSQRSCG